MHSEQWFSCTLCGHVDNGDGCVQPLPASVVAAANAHWGSSKTVSVATGWHTCTHTREHPTKSVSWAAEGAEVRRGLARGYYCSACVSVIVRPGQRKGDSGRAAVFSCMSCMGTLPALASDPTLSTALSRLRKRRADEHVRAREAAAADARESSDDDESSSVNSDDDFIDDGSLSSDSVSAMSEDEDEDTVAPQPKVGIRDLAWGYIECNPVARVELDSRILDWCTRGYSGSEAGRARGVAFCNAAYSGYWRLVSSPRARDTCIACGGVRELTSVVMTPDGRRVGAMGAKCASMFMALKRLHRELAYVQRGVLSAPQQWRNVNKTAYFHTHIHPLFDALYEAAR